MSRVVALAGLLSVAGCSSNAPPATSPPAAVATPAPAPTPTPAPQATWPFRAWDRAEAIYFNDLPYGPGIPLRVYDEANGWSPHIVERKPIDRDLGDAAVRWTNRLGG